MKAIGVLVALTLSGCCCRRDACCPGSEQPIGVVARSTDARYEAAHKAWLDGIMANNTWAQDCVFAALSDPDPVAQLRRKAECEKEFHARAVASTASFERTKAALGR